MAAPEMLTPTSHSAAARAVRRRRAYGAPDAPVMPRKTRTGRYSLRPLGWERMRPSVFDVALGGFEEDRELAQVVLSEPRERRHRAARVHARGTLQVRDLEGDAEVLRADVREHRGAEVVAAVGLVGVAVQAARLGEQLAAGERVLVVREALILRPGRDVADDLAAEGLLRRRALVREDAHRDDDQRRRDERD